MADKRGCCSGQLGCCFGGLGCRFCCSCFPKAYLSTTTRLMYTLMLFLGTALMCISHTPMIREEIMDKIPFLDDVCETIHVGGKCDQLFGFLAVYRTAFALSGFFLLMALATICVTKSAGWRARFHNGAWIWKYLILIGIGVGVWAIPDQQIDHFKIVWMYIALTGAVAFILIQLWLLVFFARSLGNKINHRVAEGGSSVCWYGLSSLCTLVCFVITALGIMALFSYFTAWEGCTTNKIFIGINAGLCLLLSVLSVVICCGPRDIHSSLLQAGIISVYITYLTWTALSSAPRESTPPPESLQRAKSDSDPEGRGILSEQQFYCGPDDASFQYNEWVLPYVGVALMFFTVVYSSIGTSSDNAVALGVNVRRYGAKGGSPPVGSSSTTREDQEASTTAMMMSGRRDEAEPPSTGCCSCFTDGGDSNGRPDDPKMMEEDWEEEPGGGQSVLDNERNGCVYNYSLFHVVFCLASMYIMMTLTAWTRPEESNLTVFNQNWATVWIKMSSSWACVLLYLMTLPLRRFGRYSQRVAGRHQQDDRRRNHHDDSSARLEIYERETVT